MSATRYWTGLTAVAAATLVASCAYTVAVLRLAEQGRTAGAGTLLAFELIGALPAVVVMRRVPRRMVVPTAALLYAAARATLLTFPALSTVGIATVGFVGGLAWRLIASAVTAQHVGAPRRVAAVQSAMAAAGTAGTALAPAMLSLPPAVAAACCGIVALFGAVRPRVAAAAQPVRVGNGPSMSVPVAGLVIVVAVVTTSLPRLLPIVLTVVGHTSMLSVASVVAFVAGLAAPRLVGTTCSWSAAWRATAASVLCWLAVAAGPIGVIVAAGAAALLSRLADAHADSAVMAAAADPAAALTASQTLQSVAGACAAALAGLALQGSAGPVVIAGALAALTAGARPLVPRAPTRAATAAGTDTGNAAVQHQAP